MSEPIKKTDLSSLTQDQQNHLFQQHQLQQQQHSINEQQHQNQDYTAQSYNPSSYYHTPQQNPYYHPNGYPNQLPEDGFLPEPAQNYQNTLDQGQASDHGVGQHNPNYQPIGYSQQLPENGSLPEPALNYQSAPGYLTPAAAAAVAALSKLVQFAGSMEGATWTGQGQQGQFAGSAAQPAYMGSGRRGSWPFRGRSPGRGRGWGRGRTSFSHLSQNGASSSSNPNSSADVATEPTAANQEEQKPETANPNKPPSRAFRCELCNIECNGLDILEQHKNGKKHKKNMEKAGQLPLVAVATESEHVAEKTLGENTTTESERGTKRKMRGGQNGKITRRVNESPKVVIPKICDLCYVKCDTQEVFDRHLAGKKHMSKLKRYEGHQSMYGAVGLQALYPHMSQTLVQQQGIQQIYHVPQEPVPQPGANMPPQHHYSAEPLLTNVESTVPGPSS